MVMKKLMSYVTKDLCGCAVTRDANVLKDQDLSLSRGFAIFWTACI